MTEAVKKNGVNFGIILGAISILVSATLYAVDLELMVSIWVGIILFLVNLTIGIVGVAKAKKQLGGFISFKEAFTTYFIIMVVGSIIGIIFSYILFNLIDPGAKETMTEMVTKKTVEWMQAAGSTTEQIRETVEQMESVDNFSALSLLKSFFYGLIVHIIIGLIVAAAMKKNKPEFE